MSQFVPSVRHAAGFVARFALTHLLAYLSVGLGVLALQPSLPEASQTALEFFEPYRRVSAALVVAQLMRGATIGLALFPLRGVFLRVESAGMKRRNALVLFGVLWGLTVIGSVEPIPGSIEGAIYTMTPLGAHVTILLAGAVYAAAVAWIFVAWQPEDGPESEPGQTDGPQGPRPSSGYYLRFVTVHVLTYLVAGVTLFYLQDYADVIPTHEGFALWRPLDHPLVQSAVVFQLLRGAVMAAALAPFYRPIFNHKRGWLRLFGALWGLTFLSAPNMVQGFLTDLAAATPISEYLFGTVEITVQMAGFAWLLWWWERRRRDRPRNARSTGNTI